MLVSHRGVLPACLCRIAPAGSRVACGVLPRSEQHKTVPPVPLYTERTVVAGTWSGPYAVPYCTGKILRHDSMMAHVTTRRGA